MSSQHALLVPSSPPRVLVCAYSALQTAGPQLRPPPSACVAMATTVVTLISRMNPAPVSFSDMAWHSLKNHHTPALYFLALLIGIYSCTHYPVIMHIIHWILDLTLSVCLYYCQHLYQHLN